MLKAIKSFYLIIRGLLGTKIFWREFFYFLSALLLIFIILEIIWPNIILAYFNLNYLLLIYIITALFLLIVSDR
ncbi:MAG: hypothetical protein ACYC40_01070 [Patescibacteria group bacterium]